MDQNPYQSPTAELTNPADLIPSPQRLGPRRPILMAAIGVFIGGGTFIGIMLRRINDRLRPDASDK